MAERRFIRLKDGGQIVTEVGSHRALEQFTAKRQAALGLSGLLCAESRSCGAAPRAQYCAAMSFSIPCPHCRQTVSAPLGYGGRYVSCGACGASFLVIDEATLPPGEVVEFRPPATAAQEMDRSNPESAAYGAGSGLALRSPVAIHQLDAALAAEDADDSLKPLATVSVFLGGFSLALVCVPPLAVVSSVAGIAMGIVSLQTTGRHRAILGTLLNTFALLSAAALLVELLRDLPGS